MVYHFYRYMIKGEIENFYSYKKSLIFLNIPTSYDVQNMGVIQPNNKHSAIMNKHA